MIQVQACSRREEEQSWLNSCLLAEVKNHDLLNDIGLILRDAGFLNVKAKYVGGLRVLLECSSSVEAQKVLREGASSLSNWFTWVCPWTIEKEMQRPGRLIWVSIVGVPLHVWTHDTFKAIGNVFGCVMEVEDWTEGKDQIHIGRVLILSNSEHSIRETINLTADGHSFTVIVAEEVAEIIDFGPRYEMGDSLSENSADLGSGCGDGEVSPVVSEGEASVGGSVGKAKRLSEHQLEIVEALIASSNAVCDELEDGEIGPGQPNSGAVNLDGPGYVPSNPIEGSPDVGHSVAKKDLGCAPSPIPVASPSTVQPVVPSASASATKLPVLPNLPSSSSPVTLLSNNQPFSKPPCFKSRPGALVGKLSLRAAKRLARLKLVSKQSSSNSHSKRHGAPDAARPLSSTESVPEIVKPAQQCPSSSTETSRREHATQLGGLVGFQYGKSQNTQGADTVPQ